MGGNNKGYCKECNNLSYNSCAANDKHNELYCAYCNKRETLKDGETLEALNFEWRE